VTGAGARLTVRVAREAFAAGLFVGDEWPDYDGTSNTSSTAFDVVVDVLQPGGAGIAAAAAGQGRAMESNTVDHP
jgi:hypothetical protein